ncbi:Unknown protein, partial [Striga hermonthica]
VVNEVSSGRDMMAHQIAELTEQMRLMNAQTMQPVQTMTVDTCVACGAQGHQSEVCPSAFDQEVGEQYADVNALQEYQNRQPNDPFSNTYNPGWRNHPHFSWSNNNNTLQPPRPNFNQQQPRPNLMQQQSHPNFIPRLNYQQQQQPQQPTQGSGSSSSNQDDKLDKILQFITNQDSSIKRLETQVGQLATRVGNMEAESDKGKLPSQPEQAKAITVLRSGKEVDNKVKMPEPDVPRTTDQPKETEESTKTTKTDSEDPTESPLLHKSPNPYKPRIPFPSRLRDEKQEQQFRDLYNMLSKVNVNFPLLEVIKSMPSYVKFFKVLVTKKRKFGDGEKVIVYEAASAMQHDLPKKERDLGGFMIKIALGNGKEASGMLDLRAGINLMPFSIFQRLGLGDLRPTRMCLQLADRLIRYPKGVVEDVLVRVGKLIVPVDFVVLDVGDVHENGNDHTILLGRPFMATTNTLID